MSIPTRLLTRTGFAILLCAAASGTARQVDSRAVVTTLASDRLEGRMTGSAGEKLASDYIVGELRKIGARPLPDQQGYLMPFDFTAGTRDGGSRITVTASGSSRTFDQRTDVQALSFSDDADVAGEVVFAGYGIVVPETQGFGYDSYATLDVRDKIVLALRYFPEDADQSTRAILARYADLRYKAMAARQRGAKALIVITGPRSPNAGQTIPMSFDTALAGSGISSVSIGANVARAIFEALPENTLESIQRSFDSGNPHVTGYVIPRVTIALASRVQREHKTGHDVLAYLPATDMATAKPWLAIGAHYDHLGRGEAGNTLGAGEEAHRIHSGADDNASGVAAVLEVGADLATKPHRRNLLLAFWSGEELGDLGSAAFANRPPVPIDEIAAYLNLDMVGRMRDNKLIVQATGTSPVWPRVLESTNVSAGFDLQVQEDPYQPTDVTTFNGAGVPCLTFFTGNHPDYHKPSDTADKIDYEDLDRVAAFVAAIAARVANQDEPPQFNKVEQTQSVSRAGVRVFTGTIPDYGTDVKGLLLSGVVAGGPAERAGLQKGDVIVEIGGQTISNIYDYTYALDVLRIGEPAKVVFIRGGQRHETTLIPAARK